jgi:hypothetical protein
MAHAFKSAGKKINKMAHAIDVFEGERKSRPMGTNIVRLQGLKPPLSGLNGEAIEIVQDQGNQIVVRLVSKPMEVVVRRGNLKYRGQKHMNREQLDANKSNKVTGHKVTLLV